MPRGPGTISFGSLSPSPSPFSPSATSPLSLSLCLARACVSISHLAPSASPSPLCRAVMACSWLFLGAFFRRNMERLIRSETSDRIKCKETQTMIVHKEPRICTYFTHKQTCLSRQHAMATSSTTNGSSKRRHQKLEQVTHACVRSGRLEARGESSHGQNHTRDRGSSRPGRASRGCPPRSRRGSRAPAPPRRAARVPQDPIYIYIYIYVYTYLSLSLYIYIYIHMYIDG